MCCDVRVLVTLSLGLQTVCTAGTAVLLHHSAMDTWTDSNVVSTG